MVKSVSSTVSTTVLLDNLQKNAKKVLTNERYHAIIYVVVDK